MIRSFNELHLSAPMLDAIARAGYTSPTPIQARAIGIALEGKDLIGCAQTGTGKTAAFAPRVERILAVTPLDRQTLCFSATMPEEVERLVRKHLSRPERVEVGSVAKPVAAVTQRLYATDNREKMPLLLQLLGQERGQ